MKRLPAALRLVSGIALAAWLVVVVAFWLLRGPSARAAIAVAVVGTVALAVLAWWLSGRLPLRARPGPKMFLVHGLVALLSGSLMILLTYWAPSISTGRSIGDLAREANFLGAEFVFWIWLYAFLTAGSYGSRFAGLLRKEREAASRAEARAAEARLAVLRGQLNPHFLFNALHCVSALVRRDPAQAELALERLGDLLRVSLDDNRQTTIDLADELAFARTYLELEQMGMGDRLVVHFDVDDAALDSAVPPFALQALAENAVRHGVGPIPAGGRVAIEVRDRPGSIEVTVRDDGRGMAAGGGADSGGGLANLRDRLEALYGDTAKLDIHSPCDGGFVARLEVPRA